MSTTFKTQYRNVFAELGKDPAAVEQRLKEVIHFYFYGAEDERVYYPVGEDRASENHISTPKTEAGMRTIPMLDAVKDAFEMIWEEQKEKGNVFVIRPKKASGVGRIEKDKAKLDALYEEGWKDAENCYLELLEYLEK